MAQVWRKTPKKRIVAKLRAIKAELRYRMHEPIASADVECGALASELLQERFFSFIFYRQP